MNRALPATSTRARAGNSAVQVSLPRTRHDRATLRRMDHADLPTDDEVDHYDGEFHGDGHDGEDGNRTRQEAELVDVRQDG